MYAVSTSCTDVEGGGNSIEWSHDIGWGYGTSNDGVVWKQNALPTLMPELDMDCAVFLRYAQDME